MAEGFRTLEETVIDTGLCMRCGGCVASCPENVLRYGENRVELAGECIDCGTCVRICPGRGTDMSSHEERLFGTSRKSRYGSRFGIYRKRTHLTSSRKEFVRAGYFGGRVTSVLISALEEGLIDGALLTDWGKGESISVGTGRLARTREDVISLASSKYVFSPVLTLLREVNASPDLRSIAVVALPCQIQALRNMEEDPIASRYVSKVEFVIGLNCGAPMMSEDDWRKAVHDLSGVDPEEVRSFRYRKISSKKIRLEVVVKGGSRVYREMNTSRFLLRVSRGPQWERCRMCPDYSAELSDITFGAPVVRTEKGERLLDSALERGYLKRSSFMKRLSQSLGDLYAPLRKRRWTRRSIRERRRRGEVFPVYR